MPTSRVSKGGLGIGLARGEAPRRPARRRRRRESAGLGKGASFTVTLPMSPRGATRRARRARVPLFGEQPRLLVVDDNVDAADTLATLLRTHGCPVRSRIAAATRSRWRTSRNRTSCCSTWAARPARARVARRLRERSAARAVFAVTGWGQDDDRRRTRESGFDRHFVKPVDADGCCARSAWERRCRHAPRDRSRKASRRHGDARLRGGADVHPIEHSRFCR